MQSNKPREVTLRRTPPTQPREAAHGDTGPDTPHAPSTPLPPAEDPADDLPVSSEQPDAHDPWIAAPSYGEMGLSLDEPGLDLAPLLPADADAQVSPLEAWHAAYGHPAQTELLHRSGVVAALAAAAIGADDRVPVATTDAYPWRCICQLVIAAADGTRWLGTGWLAGPRTIITAGHCVYLHRHGGWARQVEVVPGQNAGQRPYGSAVAASFRSVRGWTIGQRATHDYGALILPPDHAFGNLLGYFGYANLADLALWGARASLAGYPGDRPRGTQWYRTQPLAYLAPRTLEFAGGSSGAPIWLVRNTQRYVAGIHVGGPQGGSAIRIDAPVFANLGEWKREGA